MRDRVACLMGRLAHRELPAAERQHFGHEREAVERAELIEGREDLLAASHFHHITDAQAHAKLRRRKARASDARSTRCRTAQLATRPHRRSLVGSETGARATAPTCSHNTRSSRARKVSGVAGWKNRWSSTWLRWFPACVRRYIRYSGTSTNGPNNDSSAIRQRSPAR